MIEKVQFFCFHQVQREVAGRLFYFVDFLGFTEKLNYTGISWNPRREKSRKEKG
jgi:hypothetical protein